MSTLEIITKEINTELEKVEIQKVLLSTTFKGLSLGNMKRAMFEGMTRGFSFKNFLEKDVYAIPFKDGYSLITSIDYARKLGMRSGVVGKSEPIIDELDKKIISCSVTIEKQTGTHIGKFTAKVYFDEYNTGKNLWISKPRTMICKVAEMHALRSACPEEMAQVYVEEEMQKEVIEDTVDDKFMVEIDAIKTTPELKTYYLENKGKGKAFDKYVTAKKLQLKNENL
jgi:hypothetical protein